MLRRSATLDATARRAPLVFACPRDNGANVLQRISREGSPSRTERSANHAITELQPYIAWTKTEARLGRRFPLERDEAVKIGGFNNVCHGSDARINGNSGRFAKGRPPAALLRHRWPQ
jgi:hypothetical protein